MRFGRSAELRFGVLAGLPTGSEINAGATNLDLLRTALTVHLAPVLGWPWERAESEFGAPIGGRRNLLKWTGRWGRNGVYSTGQQGLRGGFGGGQLKAGGHES
jgi:hypothetical protein